MAVVVAEYAVSSGYGDGITSRAMASQTASLENGGGDGGVRGDGVMTRSVMALFVMCVACAIDAPTKCRYV